VRRKRARHQRAESRAAAGEKARGFGFARVEPAALQRMARQREIEMIGDEIAVQQHIAVDQDQIIATRRGDAAVARARGAKADVFLPDVRDAARESARDALDEIARFGARAVVGDDHFVGQPRLRGDAVERGGQRTRPVVGDDDEARARRARRRQIG